MKVGDTVVALAPAQVQAPDLTIIQNSPQKAPEIKPQNIQRADNVSSHIPQPPVITVEQQQAEATQGTTKPQVAMVALAPSTGQSDVAPV